MLLFSSFLTCFSDVCHWLTVGLCLSLAFSFVSPEQQSLRQCSWRPGARQELWHWNGILNADAGLASTWMPVSYSGTDRFLPDLSRNEGSLQSVLALLLSKAVRFFCSQATSVKLPFSVSIIIWCVFRMLVGNAAVSITVSVRKLILGCACVIALFSDGAGREGCNCAAGEGERKQQANQFPSLSLFSPPSVPQYRAGLRGLGAQSSNSLWEPHSPALRSKGPGGCQSPPRSCKSELYSALFKTHFPRDFSTFNVLSNAPTHAILIH